MAITHKFVPKHENIDALRNDVRLVFVWNALEADFDLKFVGPDMPFMYSSTVWWTTSS